MSEQATETTTEQTEKAPTKEVVRTTEKPMGVQQRRDLAKLIDNDFESLFGELDVFANELRLRRHRQIEEEYREREEQARQVVAEWGAFTAGLRGQCDEWLARKRAEGFAAGGGRYGGAPYNFNSIEVSVPEKERALKEVDNLVAHQKMTARQSLERQRLAMQRDILLDGLGSGKARELLDKMPNPRELLAQVMEAARESGLVPREVQGASVQAIEGGVQVRYDHGDPQAVYIGEVME